MNPLATLDPATVELLASSALAIGLLASAALTIAALPWTDQEIAQVDRAARGALATPVRRVVALSRQALSRQATVRS